MHFRSLILLIVFFLPLSVFSDNEWIPRELNDSIKSFEGEYRSFDAEFETSVEVSASYNYPYFYGVTPLIDFVNTNLETAVHRIFEEFVNYEKTCQEKYNNDFGGSVLSYQLCPVYCLPNLISVYGSEYQSRDCPHGWTHYYGKNFWKNNNTIQEIELKDLFKEESDWCNFLLNYSDQQFTSTKHGYYASDEGFIPDLKPKDLEIFVLTERELIIIFRSYTVGGWADGPDVIAIPYDKVKAFIDPQGPLREIKSIHSLF